MRKKQIEKELIKNVVHNGDFSEISNELDFSDVKIPVKESNLKYAFFGIAAFLTSIGIAVGLSIGITEITKKNQSRDSISQTSIDPFNPAVSTKVPSISYGEFTYFYDKSQTQPLSESVIGLKLSEIDVISAISEESIHATIYSIQGRDINTEIAVSFDIAEGYYRYTN